MPKAARNKAATPNAHPIASLILSSHLKDYTFSAVRDYLRLYAAECHGLDSKAMRCKNKFVLKQLEKVRVDQILVDVEFVSLKDVLPVPWQIVIRDASSGKIVISSLVDYGSMSVEDMAHELLKYYKGPNPGPWRPGVTKFRKAYKGTHTTGLSLKSIGDALRDLGFHPDTHRILSWYSVLDMQVFSRALSGENRLIVSRDGPSSYQIYDRDGQASLQPVNFGVLVRNCSDLASGKALGPVG
ncbi:unnamed protein product [Alternaria sp. RS040]